MVKVKEIDEEIHYIVDKKTHRVIKQFLNARALHKEKKFPFHNNSLFNSFWKTIQESDV